MPRSPILARSAGASGRFTAWTETDSTSNSAETWFRGPTCSRLGSVFSIVLIAIELMASVYMYMMDKSVHVEIMLLIAITTLTRKVVVLDLESKGDPALYMLGLAALLGTLVGGYYLVKRLAGPGDGH